MLSDDQRPRADGGPIPADSREPVADTARMAIVRDHFFVFFDAEYALVVRFLMRCGASLHDAEDATQEAFTNAWLLMGRDGKWAEVAVRHLAHTLDQARDDAWDLVDDPPGSAIPAPGGDSLFLHATGDQPWEPRDFPDSIETFGQVAAESSALLGLLANLRANASGVDLSRARVHSVDALEGVIWTTGTTWPRQLAGQIRAQSKEIRPGVYQVTGGASPGQSELIGL